MSRNSGRGQRLYERAKRLLPGGTQLLTKRPEMFLPGGWPSYYRSARGVEVEDLDGNRFVDMSYSGVGSCVLGYADPDVDAAVHAAVDAGSMTTLNCPEEVELAELLVELHPWAEQVRYARAGGEAMAVAVRIARAATGRDRVAFCGYHGWHDWYLAANLSTGDALDGHLLSGLDPAGVPRGLAGTALPFRYNRPEELAAILAQHPGEIAAVVMEPIRGSRPDAGFLEGVRQQAAAAGAVLVFDEITAGLRLTTGGAHLVLGTEPDVAVFAKGLGNGYPVAAIIGRAAVMEAAQRTFISSTFWTDRIGPAAALATLRKHREHHVAEHLQAIGRRVQDGWRAAAGDAGLEIEVGGMAPLGTFSIRHEDERRLRTLFTQLMLDRGFLATKAFYAMYAHREEHVDAYLGAVRESFATIAAALRQGNVDSLLRGEVAQSGFQRLT